MKNKFVLCISILFFIFMGILTVTEKQIKYASLVHVNVTHLHKKIFSINGDLVKCYAVTSKNAGHNGFFIVETKIINGEKCFFAKRIVPEVGKSQQKEFPILDDSYNGEPVIISSDRSLSDGMEVYVIPSV